MADWTTDAVDTLEQIVDTVRDKTVVPAQNVTRTIVEVPRHLDNSTRRAEELPYYEREQDVPDEPAD